MKGFFKPELKRGASVLFLVVLLCGAGCVSEELSPDHNPKLGVAQSSDGWITFRLETERGYKYQILYRNPSDQQWKPVKGCESIIGTGEAVEIKKRFNSRGPVPQFTVSYSEL